MKALINARVLTPAGFKDGQTVVFKGGMITHVCDDQDCPEDAINKRDLGGAMLLPGFIDVQVNGGGGVLFNDEPTIDGIRAIGAAHRKYGTTGFFPTLITDMPGVIARAIKAVEEAIEQGVPGVLGIHLEGPFLNKEKCGVHDSTKFAEINAADIELMSSLKGGAVLVTLAPEKTTPAIIKTLCSRGVIVSAGHTQASYGEALAAMDAGLTGFTHLYNAMRQLHSRMPGLIAAALEDDRAWRGIIVDGYHVHPAMLRLAYRAQVHDQMFLVTDAMSSVGATDKKFSLGGVEIEVMDGKCTAPDGALAGSDLDMISAVRNAIEMLGADLEQAVRMASILPAQFMGLQNKTGEIRAGLQADFIVVSKELKVIETWIGGQTLT